MLNDLSKVWIPGGKNPFAAPCKGEYSRTHAGQAIHVAMSRIYRTLRCTEAKASTSRSLQQSELLRFQHHLAVKLTVGGEQKQPTEITRETSANCYNARSCHSPAQSPLVFFWGGARSKSIYLRGVTIALRRHRSDTAMSNSSLSVRHRYNFKEEKVQNLWLVAIRSQQQGGIHSIWILKKKQRK